MHLSIPFLSAFIGWITTFLAVRMLFYPRQEWRFLGLRIQGVFPKRQKQIAHRLGEIVSTQLFSSNDVKRLLEEGVQTGKIVSVVEQRLDLVLKEKLIQVFPMAAMFLSDSMVEKVKTTLLAEIAPMVDQMVADLGSSFDNNLNIHKIVEERVSAFSSEHLETILFAIMKKEFTFIELVCGVLGFFIGIIQVLLMIYFPAFGF